MTFPPETIKKLAALKFGCKPEELLAFRILEDGGAVIIAPTGQKFTYTKEELNQQVGATHGSPLLARRANSSRLAASPKSKQSSTRPVARNRPIHKSKPSR